MKKPKTKKDWLPYIGCLAWFNKKDGFLEIAVHARLVSLTNGCIVGPTVHVMGVQGSKILITANGASFSGVEKKHVRIIGDAA